MKRSIRHRLMFMTTPTDGEPAGGGSTAQEGAAGQSTADGASTTSTEPGGTTEPEPTDWKAKFDAQREINRKLEERVKGEAGPLKKQVEDLTAELAKAQGREAEHAELQKHRETETKALEKANDRIRRSEVRAAAAKLLKDPADALLYLDLDQFEVSDDGEVDTAAVTEALEGLVKSKPYLAAEGGAGPIIHSPTANREGSTGKKQWTRADLQGKTPEQIATAKREGLLQDLLAGKTN